MFSLYSRMQSNTTVQLNNIQLLVTFLELFKFSGEGGDVVYYSIAYYLYSHCKSGLGLD